LKLTFKQSKQFQEIRVIDEADVMLGIMSPREAESLAKEQGLDLVVMNAKAFPPVCKILDYGKFKYAEAKKAWIAKQNQTIVKIKEVKIGAKTDPYHLGFKVKRVREFIADGDKVKITLRFRGREIIHPDIAQRQIETIIDQVNDVAKVEVPIKMAGRTMSTMLAPR